MIPLIERYNNISLREAKRSSTVTDHVAMAWLRQHAPVQYDRMQQWAESVINGHEDFHQPPNIGFWRGKESAHINDEYVITVPTAPRTARNVGDFYRVIVDASNPEWPSRAHAIVGTTEQHRASQYGRTYWVISPDDARIACTGREDIWDTDLHFASVGLRRFFEYALGDLHPSNAKFIQSAYNLGTAGRNNDDRTPKSLEWWDREVERHKREALKLLRQLAKQQNKSFDQMYNEIINRFETFCQYAQVDHKPIGRVMTDWVKDTTGTVNLVQSLRPVCRYEQFGMALVDPYSLYKDYDHLGEVWTNSPCLLIQYQLDVVLRVTGQLS